MTKSMSQSNLKLFRRIVVLLCLCCITIFSFTTYPKLRETTINLFQSNQVTEHIMADFTDTRLRGWQTRNSVDRDIRIEDKVIHIKSLGKNHRDTDIFQPYHVQGKNGLYVIKGQYKTQRIEDQTTNTLSKPYGAFGQLRFYNDKNRQLSEIPLFHSQTNHGWHHFERHFPVKEWAAKIDFSIRLNTQQGDLRLKNIGLYRTEPQPYFSQLRFSLMSIWAVIGFWVILPAFHALRIQPFKGSMLIISAGFIAIAFLLPREYLHQLHEPIRQIVPDALEAIWIDFLLMIGHQEAVSQRLEINKLGHLLCFAVATFIAICRRGQLSIVLLISFLIVLAPLSETLQLFASSRSPSLRDITIDIMGIAFGLACFFFTVKINQTFNFISSTGR